MRCTDMKLRWSFILPLILLLFALLNNLWADAPKALQECAETEQKALELESRGDFKKAAEHLEKALYIILKSYSKEDSESVKGILSGVSEAYLHKLVELYENDFRYRPLLKLLDSLAKDKIPAGRDADLSAWVTWYQARNHLRTGDINQSRAKYTQLGFINQWQIIGAFDNESGSGFNVAYPPEKEINLEASYEGKTREVRWRYLDIKSVAGGYLNMSALIRPKINAAGYALTYIFSPHTQSIAFRIGSDESIKLWLNDDFIYGKEIQRRRCGFDQDITGGILEKGWNKVLVKTTTTKGAWGFRLRITDLAGNPIKGLKVTADPKTVKQITYTESKGLVKLGPGGLDFLEQALKQELSEVTPGRYYFYSGIIHQARADSDVQKPEERTAFQNAIQVAPHSSYYHYYLARALREEKTISAEKEENQYRVELEEALRLSPRHSLAAQALAEYYLYSFPIKQKSYEYIKKALKSNPDAPATRYLETRWFEAKLFTTEAYLRREQLARQYPDYLPIQSAYARQLMAEKRLEKAARCYEHMLRNIDYTDDTARRKLIYILICQDKTKIALQLYEVIALCDPYNTSLYVERARIFEGQRDYARALKETSRALQICPEDYSLLALKGEYLHHLGKKSEAIRIWQKALAINPGYIWLQRYLDFVRKEKDTFERPFRIKLETILTEIKAHKEVKVSGEFATYNLLDQAVVKVNPDGTRRQYIHQIVKILNEKGIRDFDTYSIRHNSERQWVKVLTARVIHPDGRSEEARIDASYIDLPPLEIADLVELAYRVEDTAPGFFGDYFGDIFLFGSNNPTYKSIYTLITPIDKPLYFNKKMPKAPRSTGPKGLQPAVNFDLKPKVTKDKTTITYHWSMKNLPGFRPEPLMLPLDEIVPVLEVSSYKDWAEFGLWYWHLIKRQYDINDEMRFKLKQLLHPNMTVEEKIKAVYNFVIGEIRYEAWEYGIHGWKPYKASTIFTRRFGDCKDKALLINVFLNELGIKAYPVLIYAAGVRGQEDLTLPMVEHFNHCISYVTTETGKEFWLDGTAAFIGTDSIPAMDTGATVFVLDETGGEIHHIPHNKPEDNAKREETVIRIDTNGNAVCNTIVEMTGERASVLRYHLANPAKRSLFLERVFGGKFGGARITSAEFSPLANLDTPVHYQLTVTLPGFLQPREQEYAFRTVLFSLNLSRVASQSERNFDLVLPLTQYPCSDELEIEFILPVNVQIKSLPDNLELKTPFGEYSASYERKGNEISFTEKFSISTTRINKEDYKEFRDFCSQIMAQQEKEVIIAFK